MSASIFISFAAQDLKVADTLCKALENRGFRCWISSRDILPGENFQVAIVRAIRTARMMLLVFTANSNNSEEITKELALASQAKLIVVPLRIEDVAPNDAFAYEFATRQWINFFSDWEVAINQLSERISLALGPELAEAEAASDAASMTNAAAPALTAAGLESAADFGVAAAPAAKAATLAPARAAPAAPASAAAEKIETTLSRPATAMAPRAPAPPRASESAAASEAVRPARIGLYVAIGVALLALVGAGLFAPALFGPKPPSAAAVAAQAAAHPAPAPPVPPGPASAPASASAIAPAAAASAAASPDNALASPAARPRTVRRRERAGPAAPVHPDNYVPF